MVLGILLVEGLRPMDEREAVRRLQEGDIGGLSALVSLHQKKAVQSAYLVTSDPALAEDIVQAAFVHAYERIHQFNDARPFAPWFIRIVMNDAIKAAQRRKREVSLEAGEPSLAELLSDGNPGPATQMEEADFRLAVRKALGCLAPRQRAAIVMRYFLEMTEDEIADTMHSARGTVKSRLHRARERLQGLLNPLAGRR
jgi:RNA polymerase sigma-70 factor (ECF subfamily)